MPAFPDKISVPCRAEAEFVSGGLAAGKIAAGELPNFVPR
jgi:hypothetical protein